MLKLLKFEIKKIIKFKIVFYEIVFLILLTSSIIYITNKNNMFKTDYLLTLTMFLSFLTTLKASKILMNEIELGTIKNLLTKSFNRTKVFVSKLITITLLTLIYIALIYLLSIMLINILHININHTLFTKEYFICGIPTLFITIISYSLSYILQSSNLSYIISICLMVFGPTISMFLLNLKIKSIQYTILPYLDFKLFLNKTNISEINQMYKVNLSGTNGVIVLILTIVIITLISLYLFNKKDIK